MAIKTIKVIQDPQKPIKRELLAESIIKMSESLAELRRSGLNEKGVLVLLSHKTGFSITSCRDLLDGLADLRKSYCG